MVHLSKTRIKHVQQDAERRYTAELESQAQSLFNLTHAHSREALAKLVAEAERLQARIHDLKAATRPGKHLVVCMQFAQVSHTRLQETGLKPSGIQQADMPSRFVAIAHGCRRIPTSPAKRVEFCDAEAIAKLVDTLNGEQAIRSVGGISLLLPNGRYSSTAIGIEIPTAATLPDGSTKIELEMLGTRIDVMSMLRADGKVRLQLNARTSTVDEAHGATLGGIALPSLKSRGLYTDCELEVGQTAVIGGFQGQHFHRLAKSQGTLELFVLFTPMLVEMPPAVDVQPDQTPTAQAPAATKKK